MSAGTPAPEIICRCATLCGFIAQLDDQAVWRLIRGEKDAAKFKDSTLPVGSSSTPAAAPTLSSVASSALAIYALCINRSAPIRRIPWATENSWKQGFLARLSWKM